MRTAVVVGGGLAGLSAALDLQESGWRVTVLEKRASWGGRAGSFFDRTALTPLDVGQHVFLRCCSAYRWFLARTGCEAAAHLQERLAVWVADGRSPGKGGPPLFPLRAWPAPAPLHLAAAVASFRLLSRHERLRALVAAARLRHTDRHAARWQEISFRAWLKEERQSEAAVQRLWDLFVLAALNAKSDAVSAAAAFMVFQEGLLRSRHAGDIGWLERPLGDVALAAARLIERGGGVARSGAPARLALAGASGLPRIGGVRFAGGETLQTAAYIVAVSPWELPAVLPPGVAADPFFARAARLKPGAILNLHVWYGGASGPILPRRFLAVSDSPLQWLFEPEPGHVCASLSGADALLPLTESELAAPLIAELARLFPEAAARPLLHHRIVRQPRATFVPAPGADEFRLPQQTPIPNLFLAGDWTQTGWPATMEGAVRSGQLCAAAVRQAFPSV